MDEKTLKEALIFISQAGIEFSAGHLAGGFIPLNAEDAIKFVHNQEQFFADLEGTDIETIRQYKKHQDENFQCTATTAKGKRCSYQSDTAYSKISEFRYGVTTLCTRHLTASS